MTTIKELTATLRIHGDVYYHQESKCGMLMFRHPVLNGGYNANIIESGYGYQEYKTHKEALVDLEHQLKERLWSKCQLA